MRFVYSVCLLIILTTSSCTDSAQQNQPNVYYDVLSFVKHQIDDLAAQKPLVKKTVSINQRHTEQQTNDVNWSRELELFTQVDINKPALRNSYQIVQPDSLTYRYTLKKSEERLTVRSLTVQLDSATHQPRLIEAVLQTSNPLYSSERHLLLESGPIGKQQWRVKHYKLTGYQKLSFFDKNQFLVEGQLN